MHAEAAIWYASFLYSRKVAPASALWNIHLSQLLGKYDVTTCLRLSLMLLGKLVVILVKWIEIQLALCKFTIISSCHLSSGAAMGIHLSSIMSS